MGKESPHLKGSTTTHFNFTFVQLYPHNSQVEKDFIRASSKSCGNAFRNFTNSDGMTVFNVHSKAFERRTCRKKLGFAKFELAVVKLDKFKGKSYKEDLLYFAEVPSHFGRRWRGIGRYTPKSYQLPLKRANAPNCTFCGHVKKSTSSRPHKFAKHRPRAVMLDEEWGSTTCETRPGSFLTRYMIFRNKHKSFEGYFHYYSDPYCKKIDFMVHAKGNFTGGVESDKLKGGENFVFTVDEASITPYKKSRTRQLNSMSRRNECGEDGKWQTGVASDITKSKGCRLYGINLPHTEYDLVKMEENENKVLELYLGQRFSDGSSPVSPQKRPTSYQIPMVQCAMFKSINFVPPTPEPTSKPSTRYPRPKAINPILTVPTLKRDDDKTTPKQGGKTSKGTKGSSTNGSTVKIKALGAGSQINSSALHIVALLAVVAGLL